MKVKSVFIILLVLIACKTKNTSTTNVPENKTGLVKEVEKNKSVSSKLSEDSLDIKIGQMILVGIREKTSIEASDPLIKEIEEGKVGAVILFEKNIAKTDSKESLKKLIADLQAASSIPLFVTIDEEGGKVHRLKEKYGFVKMPSAGYLGSLNRLDSTLYYTRNLAALLAELGINLNFAPVVDLSLNKDNPVIHKIERSYSDNPTIVVQHALQSIKGHHEYGVKTILKHFPGHGSSSSDSHLGIADVTNGWQSIELIPYKEIMKSGNCDAIMTAHIVNCRLDSNCLPATLSKVIITDILRGVLGYDGVIFSDDMQMYAISKNYGLENAIKMSILSGVDILVFGNNVNQTDRASASEVHAIIKKMVQSGEIPESRINESYHRIMTLKKKKV
jgi:beta-N-acetylhexosaminidase